MSKKQRKDKRGTKPRPVKIKDGKSSVVTPTPAKAGDSSSLIVFDKKTKLFLLILLTTYFALSLLKVHTSSIANWDVMFGKPVPQSVLLGTPKFIRMDEWGVSTPAILSQYALGMPVRNDTLGGVTTPVVWGLPVKDVSTIL